MKSNPLTRAIFPLWVYWKKKNGNNQAFRLKETKRVFILFYPAHEADLLAIEQLKNKLSLYHIETVIVQFYTKSNKINNIQLNSPGQNYFLLKENGLNFWGLPSREFLANIRNKPFDLVLNLSFKPVFPFYYLSMLSLAPLKVCFSPCDKYNIYNLVFDPQGNENLTHHTNSIFEYLEKINMQR